MDCSRRQALLALGSIAGALGIGGCAAKAPPARAPAPKAPEPLRLLPIESLASAAGLEWIVLADPQALLGSDALKPGLDKLFPAFRFDAFERASAIDLRKLERVVIASYRQSTLFLLQGVADPQRAERLFRARLMTEIVRTVQRDDAVLLSGKLASGQRRAIATLQPNVVAIESDGARMAKAAYYQALGKLKRSVAALQLDGMPELRSRLGQAPLLALAPGPFEGPWNKGLHGLLAAATGVGAAVRVTPVGSLQGSFVVAGQWGDRAEAASGRLVKSWDDIARSGFGGLTGLQEPLQPPLPTHAPDAVSLTVEVGAARFLEGLRAAVSAQIHEIMQ